MIPGFDPRIMLSAPKGIVLPNIGDPWEGGFYAGLFTILNAGDVYALVVGSGASEGMSLAWKSATSNTNGTNSVIDGLANTTAMNNASHPAAQHCTGYSGGGFSDWFLPASLQFELAYRALKPTTDNNNTSYGANAYAIPPTGNYTSGNPAQTAVSNFKSGGADAFRPSNGHWTSTQISATHANAFWPNEGVIYSVVKSGRIYVRPFRQVRIK